MMTSSSELSFDCKHHIYSMLQKSFGEQACEQTQKLEEFVARLEEERLKIDAFKRELPLCMQLLNNAMEVSRQQLQSQRTNQGGRPILEEFIPLKNTISPSNTENEGNISADKANWMTSAQLWNQESEETTKPPQSQLITTSSPHETDTKLALNGKQRINGGGAFLPFSSKDRISSPNCGEAFPELALASTHKEQENMEDKKNSSSETSSRRENNYGKSGNGACVAEKEQVSGTSNANQTHRKARRCWSPDLHRRFVNALHMLGGSQVATPKQIRELMKVDGLTNDEVKSHLQKYRLHTRRPSPSPQASVTTGPQVVVLGGIWVPPEYAAAAAAHGGAQAAALYGAHAAATHHHVSHPFPAGPHQEIYPAIAPPPLATNHQLHHHAIHHHQQLHLYNNNNKPLLTQRNSSPESDFQGGAGDTSESIEDGKSESGSWKAESGGENGGETRGFEGEESAASGVTLKF